MCIINKMPIRKKSGNLLYAPLILSRLDWVIEVKPTYILLFSEVQSSKIYLK